MVKEWSDLYERLGPLVFMLFLSLAINIVQYRKNSKLLEKLLNEHLKRLRDLKTYTILMMTTSTKIPKDLRENLSQWLENGSNPPASK